MGKIMKKLCFMMGFLAFCGLLAFGDSGELREIDYILFSPDSSNSFADEAEAIRVLDSVAVYLRAINLLPGQIHIHGYAATVKNDIKPMDLSRERALFVQQELQRRGLSSELFSEPVAHGEVNLWGSNITEDDRNPNRRARILVSDYYWPPLASVRIAPEGGSRSIALAYGSRAEFPWLLLLLLLLGIILFAIILLLAAWKCKEKYSGKAGNEQAKDTALVSNGRKTQAVESSGGPRMLAGSGNCTSPLSAELMASTVVAAAAVAESDKADADLHKTSYISRSKFMDLEKAIREMIFSIPLGMYFDVHTVVEKLLQEHDDVYLTNVGHYTSAAQYHSKISSLIAHDTDIVEKAGNSYSKNIHDKFSECHLFRRK